MTSYAIGGVHGDYSSLMRLLGAIAFDPDNDRLWFAGNLVNSGAESLAVLRFVKGLGKNAVTVLGKQELQLLGAAIGTPPHSEEVFCDILNAPDRDELLRWLRRRGLIHHDAKLNFTLVHAGIPREWSFSQALTFAYEVESVFAGNQYPIFFENHRQDQSRWHAKLRGWKRLNFIANAYTRMAYCNEQGKLDFNANGPVSRQPAGWLPWYRLQDRAAAKLNIIFADETGFEDAVCPGIFPLPSRAALSALQLSPSPEAISVARHEA